MQGLNVMTISDHGEKRPTAQFDVEAFLAEQAPSTALRHALDRGKVLELGRNGLGHACDTSECEERQLQASWERGSGRPSREDVPASRLFPAIRDAKVEVLVSLVAGSARSKAPCIWPYCHWLLEGFLPTYYIS